MPWRPSRVEQPAVGTLEPHGLHTKAQAPQSLGPGPGTNVRPEVQGQTWVPRLHLEPAGLWARVCSPQAPTLKGRLLRWREPRTFLNSS